MGFRCCACKAVLTEITVRAWTVYSEQTVSIDPMTHIIRAVSPAVCRAVVKPGMEIERTNKSATWVCSNCKHSGPPSDYTPVLMCAITGEADAQYTIKVPWGNVPVYSSEMSDVAQNRLSRLPLFINTGGYSF